MRVSNGFQTPYVKTGYSAYWPDGQASVGEVDSAPTSEAPAPIPRDPDRPGLLISNLQISGLEWSAALVVRIDLRWRRQAPVYAKANRGFSFLKAS
jgi:hypothetical protein